jgi:hypothetical protein
MFRRKTNAVVIEPVSEADTPANRSKAYTPSKRERGVTTPKRGVANARLAAPASKTPTDRREARAARVSERRKMRDAMMRGEEHALLPRDQGPTRRLVRNVVDARRNVGNYFFGGLLFIAVLTANPNIAVRVVANWVFLTMMFALIVDSWLLSRRIKKTVKARLPKEAPARWRSLYTYGIMRSLSFRFMRMPKPQVKIGAKL